MISRFRYYSYAANFAQIDAMVREGPSSKIISKINGITSPYLADDWWVKPIATTYIETTA
jgi:hypothetical protein